MALRLELFNSVDGSMQFRALMGWFRFVCSNGLVVGVTRSNIHYRHAGKVGVSRIGAVLRWGLDDAENDMENLRQWQETPIDLEAIVPWVNKHVKGVLGFKAAARVFHIAGSGHDVEIVEKYRNRLPTTIRTRRTRHVPGCPPRARNAFDVSQILSWLAGDRRDIQEQLEWRQEIPNLMTVLLN